MNNVINFVGKHLLAEYKNNLAIPIHENIESFCCFSGQPLTIGVKRKNLIKKTFTDHDYIKYNSDYASLEMTAMMTAIIPKWNEEKQKTNMTKLLNYSFVCYEDKLKLLSRAEILNEVLNPESVPFVFSVTYSYKKYTSFKAEINHSKEQFTIETDLGRVAININQIKALLPIIQAWYTVKPEKKDTFFTKAEILNSSQNFNRIKEYGPEKFFKEDKILSLYRDTAFLKLLVHVLNKGE